MVVEKLIKSSIMDALDLLWAQHGINPSKKTRQTILKAAEKISCDVEEDFKKARKPLSVESPWQAPVRWNGFRRSIEMGEPNEPVPVPQEQA